jgi:hypothetical protein
MASDDCFSFTHTAAPQPPHLMLIFPEAATGEWRFRVAENVPVPVNESDLEAQVMVNPSGVCHASRLCLPYLT